VFRAWILPLAAMDPEQSTMKKKWSGLAASSPPGRFAIVHLHACFIDQGLISP
jgi:hypothetical protein